MAWLEDFVAFVWLILLLPLVILMQFVIRD